MRSNSSEFSVIICAYTEARWKELIAAIESVRQQSAPPREIIVVVDHNPRLLERVRTSIPGIVAVENAQVRGLSGARNSGIAVAQATLIAFLDEDALAEPDWLAHLSTSYEALSVTGVGGAIEPMWLAGRPDWFPDEFNWVVGCTYRGMPQTNRPVRNLIGCNMSFRREVFAAGARFRSGIGRIGTHPVGCEETEFCIRVGQQRPQSTLVYEPQARVRHKVPPVRATWRYFWSRCYAEGRSKALVAHFVGSAEGLATERGYTLRTLPLGVARGLADAFLRRDPWGLARALAIVTGLAVTTAGFAAGTLSLGLSGTRQRVMQAVPFKGMTVSHWKDTTDPVWSQPDFEPMRVLETEIALPLPDVPALGPAAGHSYRRVLSLVRLHGQPLGAAEFDLTEQGLSAAAYARRIWDAFGPRINEYLQQEGLPEITELEATGLPGPGRLQDGRQCAVVPARCPFVSVIVATHNRPESLATCLASLVSQDYPNYEVVVIDNSPSSNATADFIRQTYDSLPLVRYVREDRPGLAAAHNRGLMEVSAPIVAFTDDDVIPDQHWLSSLVGNFSAAEDVACVTGLILPLELETPAQVWFEQYGGFDKGYTRRIYDLGENRPETRLYPYAAGMLGSGANMAFKTSVLRDLGGFDLALGTGTSAMGGDDLSAFFQVITAGHKLVYEPAAIVYHAHRRTYADLRKQMYGYGVGLTAYLTKSVLDRPWLILDMLAKAPAGLVYALSSHSAKNARKQVNYPRELTRFEHKGMLYGPLAYLRSRRDVRKMGTQFSPLQSPTKTPHSNVISS